MKQFNLEEYLKNSSRKVVTRDGRNVRIICTDAKGGYPVVVLIEERYSNRESVYTFTKNGCWSISGEERINDLFFAPEKHEGWINVYKEKDGCQYYIGELFASKEKALMIAEGYDNYITTSKIEWEE